MATARGIGAKGEEIGARYLEERGWTVLERNFRDGPREIDLIVERRGVLAFVEVKSRSSTSRGGPLEAITKRKRREVETAARAWLRGRKATFSEARFDAISVHWLEQGGVRVEHVPDAWWPGGP